MTRLSVAARNMIAITPNFQNLVSAGKILKTKTYPEGAVFEGKPSAVTLDRQSAKAFIVVTSSTGWSGMNEHNTMRFPRLFLDIWAAPTRNADFSVKVEDADDLIEEVGNALIPYFHTVNTDVAGVSSDPLVPYMGEPTKMRYWGTATQIATKTGVPILGSELSEEPDFRDVIDGNGARMARLAFNVSTI